MYALIALTVLPSTYISLVACYVALYLTLSVCWFIGPLLAFSAFKPIRLIALAQMPE